MSKKTRLNYAVDDEKYKALSLIKTIEGYKSLQAMIDAAIEEKYGKNIIELRLKGLLK